MPPRCCCWDLSEVVVVEDDGEDGLVKLPGASTKDRRIIHAKRFERMLCERGILCVPRSMFMYRVWNWLLFPPCWAEGKYGGRAGDDSDGGARGERGWAGADCDLSWPWDRGGKRPRSLVSVLVLPLPLSLSPPESSLARGLYKPGAVAGGGGWGADRGRV